MKKTTNCIIFLLTTVSLSAQTLLADNDTIETYKSLKLKGVEVTAQRRAKDGTTSYVMNRNVLDHAQVTNLSDIMALMPGGRTVNSNLTDDSRLSLRTGSFINDKGYNERGNAAFGTAIEVDGMRLDNNAMVNEIQSSSTRNISSSNIGSIEIISGIAGVEYGDIANGILKVNPRKGYSQWIIEGSLNPYTRQVALNKGFNLFGNRSGFMERHENSTGSINISLEHAESFRKTASPYDKYQRNILSTSFDYSNRKAFENDRYMTYTLHAALTGNIGGSYDEADPDKFSETYSKTRDNQLRGSMDFSWLYSLKRGNLLKITMHGAFSTADKRTENYTNVSGSPTPLVHTMQTGYALAQDYDPANAIGGIVIGPSGYWYERQFIDQKPLTGNQKLKAEWIKVIREKSEKGFTIVSKAMLGVEHNSSRNNGLGEYYEDLSYAKDGWRPYVYKDLPTMHNTAIFAEEKLTMGKMQLTAGLREDLTSVAGSEYGTVSSLSPRVTMRFRNIKLNPATASHRLVANFHAGWGKSVKLPSFQVLFPSNIYDDTKVFNSTTNADNKSYYAYYTNVQKTLYNSSLKWQYSNQVDLGLDATYRGVKLSVSGFWTQTRNPYQKVYLFTPISYNTTATADGTGLTIDQQTGIVSQDGTPLPYSTYNIFQYNHQYVNGSPVTRYGIEWILDMPLVSNEHLIGLSLRLDGNYYHYKGLDNTFTAAAPNGANVNTPADAALPPIIGYYNGSDISSPSSASSSNGMLSKGLNLNATLTARIPKVSLIMTLKVESTFLNYKKQLAENNNAIVLETKDDIFGMPYSDQRNCYVAAYPTYYSTWDNPNVKHDFIAALTDAKDNNPALYKQLSKLIVKSNTPHFFNPSRLSSYFSCNFSVTKEIGRFLSVSLYANNFLNNMSFINDTKTDQEASLFNSGYIPKFYYGMSVRVKL